MLRKVRNSGGMLAMITIVGSFGFIPSSFPSGGQHRDESSVGDCES
jgi:hypothetical protein